MIIGAGASAATGIPDFRELEGVHKEVAERFQLPHPLSLFDAHYFVTNPLALCRVARSLLPGSCPDTGPGTGYTQSRLLPILPAPR